MTNDDYLSIAEAADLAGVSKKTVERAYKKFTDHPEFGAMIDKRQHGSGYRYFVTKTFVDKCVTSRVKRTSGHASNLNEPSTQRSIAALTEQLEIKDRRIDKLTEMLEQKEKFSEALIRKGLNLTEATGREDSGEVADAAHNMNESTQVVETRLAQARKSDEATLFPTVKRGLTMAGRYLGKKVF